MTSPTYGDLIRIDSQGVALPEVLRRVPLGASTSEVGVSEKDLQELLFRFPQVLPITAIDATYKDVIPVCQELRTPVGYVDALYVNARGKLILTEFKLWRNPQARREVVGQILDYANALASWGYEDLQRQVSTALKTTGNMLYDLVRKHHPDLNEAEFVDNVTRYLRRGEFLLLIIGDGIQENVANIVDFIQRYSGLHFNLALVEAALYRDASGHLIMQPRILARTEIVQRFVVDGHSPQAASLDDDGEHPADQQEKQNLRFWSAVLKDYAFADPTVDVPKPTRESTLSVKVRNSGFGDWGLWFGGYLQRSRSEFGCFLAARKGIDHAVRIFEDLLHSMTELRRV